jgi:ankyrin repeat protein
MADLIFAAKTGQGALVKMLLAGGADPNAFDGEGCTALYHCDSAHVCRLLIAGKADVHYSDRQYNSPLHMASTGEIAKLILDEGADVDDVNDRQETPLHWALVNCRSDVVAALVRGRANVRVKDNEVALARAAAPFGLAAATLSLADA